MKICELYAFLNEKMPASLSCPWDNDGLMCCPDTEAEVRRVLVALDVTGRVIDEAVAGGYDLIVSHHPMVFSPLKRVEPSDPVAKKVIRLIREGISVMSFHTRLDAAEGGVNDTLAGLIDLRDARPFGPAGEEIGRIGYLPDPMPLAEFAATVKRLTGAQCVQVSDAGREVHRVAILGGSGSSFLQSAIDVGADTYFSGELKHNWLIDAPDLGMNLVAAGHFDTEDPVCKTLCAWIKEADATARVNIVNSNPVRVI